LRFGKKWKKRGVVDARQMAAESPSLPWSKTSGRIAISARPEPQVGALNHDGRTPGPRRVDGGRVIAEEQMDWSRFDDCRRVPVVGYDFHQPALLTAGGRQLRRVTDRFEGQATLVLEPDNVHDPLAAKVVLNEQKIGYLRAATAKRLHKRLVALAGADEPEAYTCLIRYKEPGKLQAHLQISYSSKLLKGYKNQKARRSRS
jgi:hypothetical protein